MMCKEHDFLCIYNVHLLRNRPGANGCGSIERGRLVRHSVGQPSFIVVLSAFAMRIGFWILLMHSIKHKSHCSRLININKSGYHFTGTA